MKKWIALVLAALLVFSLAACGPNNPEVPGESGANPTNNDAPPAQELETFQKPFHPCMQFSYPKYAHDTGNSVEGIHNDSMSVDDVMAETIVELLAMDTETLKQTLVAEYSMNNLTGYTIRDISTSTRTNPKGVSVFTYELEATVSSVTLYLCFYAFEGNEEEGWIFCYTTLHDKAGADAVLLETVFNTIEILEAN